MTRTTFALVMAAAMVTACGDSATGPGRQPCAKGTLVHGGAVSGTLSPAGCTITASGSTTSYVDYTVSVMPGVRYFFSIHTEGDWVPSLELRAAANPDSLVTSGWREALDDATSRHAELMFVAERAATYTLRVLGAPSGSGEFLLGNRVCGGTDHEIWGPDTVRGSATLDAADCVLHDRRMLDDSTYVHLYVLYLNRGEAKTITIAADPASGLQPSLVVTGPGLADGGAWMRSSAYGGAATIAKTITASSTAAGAGYYILAVGGSAFGQTGDYTLTVSPGDGG